MVNRAGCVRLVFSSFGFGGLFEDFWLFRVDECGLF